MKILKSGRDPYFQQWNLDQFVRTGQHLSGAYFDYVSLRKIQRGDIDMNIKESVELLKKLNESIPRDGMSSPIIMMTVQHPIWKKFLGKWLWESIPFVVHTGNTRYQYALANDYTHISSIVLGSTIKSDVWKYLASELKKPISEEIYIEKEYIRNVLGDVI